MTLRDTALWYQLGIYTFPLNGTCFLKCLGLGERKNLGTSAGLGGQGWGKSEKKGSLLIAEGEKPFWHLLAGWPHTVSGVGWSDSTSPYTPPSLLCPLPPQTFCGLLNHNGLREGYVHRGWLVAAEVPPLPPSAPGALHIP